MSGIFEGVTENFIVNGLPATRWIGSWIMAGGQLKMYNEREQFKDWLRSNGVSDWEARYIVNLATNGRLEKAVDAQAFIKKHPADQYKKECGVNPTLI